ncbi:PLP-dependent aminotransferase family protein [Achromobacter aloeverae]|uniref:PLP-dependent aminotransferase family protein n=1 Tax=Achromobacter aloeverae TaxID=1750518 RepID=A0A4Q1HGS2_9BURK|nr:PLP-dependent aminotransferase family protein [Achromobacter aloeverae]
MGLTLTRAGGISLQRQICDQLRDAALQGRLQSGQQLPSTRELAAALGVARNTVADALAQLAMEGFLDIRQGRRPMVTALRTLGDDTHGAPGGRPPTGSRAARASGSALAPTAAASASSSPSTSPRPSRWAAALASSDWPFRQEPSGVPLAPGMADPREFPHDLWARCLRGGARRADARDTADLNRQPLRQALLAHLVRERGVRAQAHQLFFTPSAQAALDLCARLVLDRGDAAWMESPGYGGARAALLNAGAALRGMAVDGEGMVLPDGAWQEDGLPFTEDGGPSKKTGAPPGKDSRPPKAIFVTPSHQYPTGVLMSAARRQALLDLARRAGAAILEDDYDSEFHYDGRPVAALQGLDADGRVFYVGTFAKAMISDIRVGYAVVPQAYAASFVLAQRQTGQIVAPSLQAGLAMFIERGHFSAHIRRMNRVYRERRDHLVDLLRRRLGKLLQVETPPGGMQVLATFTGGQDDTDVVRRLAAAGVSARPLSRHYVGTPIRHGLFLGFAAWRAEEMAAAVDRLEAALHE